MELTKESIQQLLIRNDVAVERAVVAIYKRQTDCEQETELAVEHNGMGFSGFDAKSGSYYAKWVLSGKHLTGKFLEKARKMSLKYWKQLIEVAKEKEQQKKDATVELIKKVFEGSELVKE